VLQIGSLRHDGACHGAISRKGSAVGLPGGGFPGAFASNTFGTELSCKGAVVVKQ